MKQERQSAIMDIISKNEIETQNQLLEALERRGIRTTQATLSRDIRDMRLSKETGADGSYHYTASKAGSENHTQRLNKIFRESVVSYDIAQNLLVIRTLPGLASAACSALDGMEIEGLIGTLAGDDTAFLAMRDEKAARMFLEEIRNLL
ncbi:MAG: arginine repressor [Oscillospiraceae bacterium]|nr:arginine repressor [Oscillospiraceae bacterium]